ncbi:DUF397 domain-containing protein [Streptosporangium nondiastaticum]|uniref:DUF397 domain-containing protein n=1 Tax=Streptosporangium nondiastaticum TaxID=35764 RepID=A0A9X7JPP1_9ACTN|nr:DUF397 domain-containing protein [Streptosporangium nondiastaticum]PSJ27404.1 DUF397 domain-containing protein [Streptosporangium nondiastaticum]
MSATQHWRKSSYSAGDGGDCVEVGADWHKSSYSDDSGGHCVEASRRPDRAPGHIPAVHVRDSKNPTGPTLTLSQPSWSRFLGHVKAHIPV